MAAWLTLVEMGAKAAPGPPDGGPPATPVTSGPGW